MRHYPAAVSVSYTHLDVYKRQMQGALKTKDVFLGVVSHEIRTPLQTILGYQSLLEQTVQGKEQREYLDAMKDASFRLLQLVNHLLDASRLAAGQSQIQEEAFEVTDFIRELRNSFSRQAEEKGLYFSVGRGTDVPDVLRGDLMKIRQIAGNLITNGLKFTEKGRVTVNLGWEERVGEQFLLIKVRDSGIGIREEDKKRIFDVFEQADSSVSRRFGGSGLGLAVCRQLVGVLKGTLAVSYTHLDVYKRQFGNRAADDIRIQAIAFGIIDGHFFLCYESVAGALKIQLPYAIGVILVIFADAAKIPYFFIGRCV